MKIFKVEDFLKLANPTPGASFRTEILTQAESAKELGGLFGIIVPGSSGEYHYHTKRESLLFVISGEGAEYLEGEEHPVRAGNVIFIRPGEKHTIMNKSEKELRFLEFFTHPPVGADKVPVK